MRKKANNRLFFLALLLVALMVSGGCKKEEQPPPAAEPKPAAKPSKPVQKQATSARIAGIAEQPLDFSTKKDPFKPFAAELVAQPKAAVAARRGGLLPIQSYDVNKFTFSGVIVGLNGNTALILDPTGKGYVVKEGMLIGNNDGRISRISAAAIEVVEQYRDDNGRVRKRTIMLTLPKKK